jgi:hypothetical protein
MKKRKNILALCVGVSLLFIDFAQASQDEFKQLPGFNKRLESNPVVVNQQQANRLKLWF